MNIMSNGSFLDEMNASSKQSELVKKLTATWEKKNSKAARAGGASLMALSLAACGGSDDTPFSQADVNAAVAAVDLTSDNAAAVTAALTDTSGTVHASVDAAKTAGAASVDITSDNAAAVAAAVAAVDTSADDAAAISLAYRDAAAALGVTGTSTMTDAELITAIKTANDAAVAAAVDLTTDNTAAINTAVAADTSFTNLADLVAAYNTAIAPAAVTTLSTSVDALTGTTGDDTYTADNTGTDVTSTADTVNGGSGTDTLNIFSDGAAGALPALTSVETVNFYDQDANFTMAGTAQDGVTTVGIIRGDGDLTATLNLTNDTVNISDVALAGTGVILTGDAAATSMTIGLSGITAAGGSANEDVHLNGAAITTVTVNNTGTSTMDALDLDAATAVTLNASAAFTATGSIETTGTAGTLTITGAGAVDLSGVDTGFTTVTASAMTGALTAEVGTHDDLVLTAGSGNDVITASTTNALATTDLLAVNAGAGTDTLVIAAAADINTAADAARYTNFETVRIVDDLDMSLISGITSIELGANTSASISNMTATQAADVTMTADNTTSSIFALATATGSSDAITVNLVNGTATTGVDVTGLSVDNFETVNLVTSTGVNDSDVNTVAFLANSADEVANINITGDKDLELTVIANTLDVVAVDINASGMSGTADFTLAQTADLVAGSSVTGTANADTMALGTTVGSTYNGGAGDDGFTTVAATLVASGSTDTVLNGGAGTDTLTISDNGSTMTDNHFTFVSNMEKITYSDGGTVSLTAGSGFASAFSDGITITAAGMDDASSFTYAGGLADVATTIALTTAGVGNAGGEDVTLTTGDAADTVTVTASSYVGQAGDSGSFIISTAAGDDTITVTTGTLLATTTSEALTITAGTGADTITLTNTTTSTTVTSSANIVMAAGDSTTAARDTITGFKNADGTNLSMLLDFAGTGAVSTFTNSVDSGTILSHNNSNGVITFDDASAFSAAVVVDSTNLSDVLTYLATNTATNDVAAFLFDSDDSGTGDATMVFHNGTTDSLVELAALADIVALTATATTTTDNFIAIA